MGWWGAGVLEGDPPLDVLCRIEDLLGVQDLYPLTAIEDPSATAKALSAYAGGLAKLARETADSREPGLSAQVVGALAMACGADLGEFASVVVDAAASDSWAKEDRERGESMAELILAVERYHQVPTHIDHLSLADKMQRISR